ncbi:LysR family transcriptional regulator [Cellulosimicrobium marinum]|uniref:LysR family transcriptional regulator n=1 Tax=Cellulosimicrobium marinum TaxID=1638992 RepID=UPI001E3F4246|nr:LysR family transcriptional regulator [Cellulosimicrobium marinum]MCB7135264.1 LysR family transcriptional regulator [Cellulosimicrobium marinum]
MDLELRHLRMIVAVAESGSVTKAAASLGVAQPALTAQLNRIDRSLGGCVFTRDRQGARPTELGELVLRHARVLLPAMSALVDDARHLLSAVPSGRTVRVGTVSTAIGGLFARRLHETLPAAAPGLTVTTATSWSVDDTAERLAAGTLDAALVGMCGDSRPPGPGLTWTAVRTDPVFVLVDERHPCAGRGVVGLGELADALWLSAPGSGCFEQCFVAACARAGFTPRAMGESDRTACIDQVRGGHAVALVQPVLLDAPGVRTVALDGAPLRWTHHVGWRHDAGERLPVHVVAAAARSAHRDAVARSPYYARWLVEHGAGTGTGPPGHTARV